MDIEFSEVLSPLKFIDEFRDEGKGVLVLHCDCKGNWKLDLAELAGGPKLNILVNN